MPCLDVSSFEYERSIGRNHVQSELIDNPDRTLGLLQSLCALDHVQTLPIVDDREEDGHVFPACLPQYLPNVVSGRLAVQVSQHGPCIEHPDLT